MPDHHPSKWDLAPQLDDEYLSAVQRMPGHPLMDQLAEYFEHHETAIDLGAGTGQNSIFLLERGLSVTAIDPWREATEVLRQKAEERDLERLKIVNRPVEKVALPRSDVIIAFFTLFLLNRQELDRVWKRIRRALKPGGLFAGQFLGVNDQWQGPEVTRLTSAEVKHLLRGWEVLHHDEVDRPGKNILDMPKRWHIHHIIARK